MDVLFQNSLDFTTSFIKGGEFPRESLCSDKGSCTRSKYQGNNHKGEIHIHHGKFHIY